MLPPPLILRFQRLLALISLGAWLAWPPAAASAATRALVVGIDNYPGGNQLQSCVNDARKIGDLLVSEFGVQPEAIKLVLNSDATAQGIRRAFQEHLIKQAAPEDEVLFFFSGHGAINTNGANAGRPIKILVPQDIPLAGVREDQVIGQTELLAWLGRLATTNVTVILDCCHAGSLSKGLPQGEVFKAKFMNLEFAPPEAGAKQAQFKEPERAPAATPRVLWLGACQSVQVSYCGNPCSQFTGALIAQVKRNPRQPIAEVFQVIQREVENNTRDNPSGIQSPALEGPAERPLVKQGATMAPAVPATTAPANVPPSAPVAVTAPSPERPFPLLLQTDAIHYFDGDSMKIKVVAGADCYLRLYVINANQEIEQLFPNRWATNNFISWGQWLEVPAPGTFSLSLQAPFGVETIVAVASLDQFTDLFQPNFSKDMFMDLGGMRPAEVSSRGLRVAAANPVNPATNRIAISRVQYTVEPAANRPPAKP